ncbi:unnamed protein product [Fraxinus pennsylvanica]|uniref:Small ribosomal subunit protein mS38 n=1 Tax=Fraxinus pennsylvanica TaxID=56036 RepID=A0AAD1Z582_9LAMI|nr:unnamed protein product [Fraxinus pennsylvanica]
MATSILQKLLRNQSQSATKIIHRLNKPHPPLPPPLLLTQVPKQTRLLDHIPLQGQTVREEVSKTELSVSSPVYPSFSFGFFLDPVPLTGSIGSGISDFVLDDFRTKWSDPDSLIGSIRPGVDDIVLDDSRTIWADSVKKKRKRKMNKHKLRKLRKRLRRKTLRKLRKHLKSCFHTYFSSFGDGRTYCSSYILTFEYAFSSLLTYLCSGNGQGMGRESFLKAILSKDISLMQL